MKLYCTGSLFFFSFLVITFKVFVSFPFAVDPSNGYLCYVDNGPPPQGRKKRSLLDFLLEEKLERLLDERLLDEREEKEEERRQTQREPQAVTQAKACIKCTGTKWDSKSIPIPLNT